MTLGGHFFLLGQDFAANAAVAALGQAGFGTGRCNSSVHRRGVTLRGHFFLLGQDFLAHTAVLSFGFTGLGAGGGNCCIRYLGVPSGRIIRIFYFFFTIELLSAQGNCDRVYIFSDLRTGCIDLTLDCNAICCSGDHFLTVLALRRNICCCKATVRRNMPIPYGFSSFSHSMTNSRDARPFRQHFITYATVATPPRPTGLGTGGCNCCICYHGVTQCGNNFLFLQHFLTYAAVAACLQTGLGTGGCNCCIRYLGMTCGFDRYRFIYALFTVLAFCFPCPSVLGTSCGLFPFTDTNIQMSAGRYHLLRFQHRIAVIAVAALGQAGLCTGCRFAFVWDRKMAARRCAFYLHCSSR